VSYLPFIRCKRLKRCCVETKYKVSAASYSIDFAKADVAAYDAFAKFVEGRDIGVLGMCKPAMVLPNI